MAETPDGGALDLMAQMVDANVRNLAFTTDRIIENLERDVAELAQTVVLIDGVLDNALVIDRATERRLMALGGRIDSAHFIHERKAASL
jgi:hypothetical protein